MNKIKVAVMNTSKEITEMLSHVLQDAGYRTCTTYTYLFKGEEEEFDEYIEANDPDIILYDIAPPYRENYFLFEALYARKSANKIPFILTTTNKNALESFVGKTQTHELIGKPFDLQEILDSIKKAYTSKVAAKLEHTKTKEELT